VETCGITAKERRFRPAQLAFDQYSYYGYYSYNQPGDRYENHHRH
jgi:hypothetical protein